MKQRTISDKSFKVSLEKIRKDKLYNETLDVVLHSLQNKMFLKYYKKGNYVLSREQFQKLTMSILDDYESDNNFFIICTMLAMLDYELFNK